LGRKDLMGKATQTLRRGEDEREQSEQGNDPSKVLHRTQSSEKGGASRKRKKGPRTGKKKKKKPSARGPKTVASPKKVRKWNRVSNRVYRR